MTALLDYLSSGPSVATPRVRRSGIADVARVAGVSKTTVSLVLNGCDRISRATAKRVRIAAEQLAYRPSRAARALQRLSTRTLAILVPDDRGGLCDPYLAQLFEGVRSAANEL